MSQEWTVIDTETNSLELIRADSQKEAFWKGLDRGVFAKRTDHVRPRTGDATLMEKQEFEEFLEENMEG